MIDEKETQNKIKEIIIYIDDFCNKHNITYYLMGGSALGAVRHNGFIPWDDDLDIFMTYENYMKFLKKCEEDIDTQRFYLQKENTKEWPLLFTKVRMNNTTFLEEDTMNRSGMHKGIYIDIMCVNNTFENLTFRYFHYLLARIVVIKSLAERGYITNNKVKIVAMKIINRIISTRIKEKMITLVRSLNFKETNYVAHFFGRAPFTKTSFPVEFLGNPKYIKFEDLKLPVPEKVENYLELRYGKKYMNIPDQKTRDEYPSHAIFVDVNKSYLEYEKQKG